MLCILLSCVRSAGKRYLESCYKQLRHDTAKDDSSVAKFVQVLAWIKTDTFHPVKLCTGAGCVPLKIDQLILLHLCNLVPDDDPANTSTYIDATISVLMTIRMLLDDDIDGDPVQVSEREARTIYKEMYGTASEIHGISAPFPISLPGIHMALSPVVLKLDLVVALRLLGRLALGLSGQNALELYITASWQLMDLEIGDDEELSASLAETMTHLTVLLLQGLGEWCC